MSFWRTLAFPVIGLSPMDGVTDATFRRIVASQGKPDVTFTEFTHVHDVCRGPDRLLDSLRYDEIERPIVAQLYGKEPELFYQAAHAVCELGFDGLDINMGCPSRNVASSGSGAGLIRTPDLAHAIMQAARQGIHDWANGQTLEAAGIKSQRAEAIRNLSEQQGSTPRSGRKPIPLSVKTRLGYDAVVVDRWIEHLLREKPDVITLHGRTLQQMYRGEADWASIARAADIARGSGVLLLGNGDVQSLKEVVRRVRESRVDGVLVGRAALGAPWFFRGTEAARQALRQQGTEGPDPFSPPLATRFAVLLEHARQFERDWGLRHFHRMRKHLGWYCKGFPGAAALRAGMFRVSAAAAVESLLAEYHAYRVTDVTDSWEPLPSGSASPLASPVSRCG
jgi:tRNA-dihydrouridine synthase